jgi:hypothetical protein
LSIVQRAGQGPGIGGFKDDSRMDVALRVGNPRSFVTLFRDPEPRETLLVCAAEPQVVKHAHALHPGGAKPGIVGKAASRVS